MNRVEAFTENHPYLAGILGSALSVGVFIGLLTVLPTIP